MSTGATKDAAVQTWLRHLKIERNLSPHTLSNYERDIQRYVDWLGDKTLASVKTSDIDEFIAFLGKELGLARSSQARCLAAVRNFHQYLTGEGVVDLDVAADVAQPSRTTSVPKALTVDEINRILASVPNDETANTVQIRDRAVLELLYSTGARVSEVLGLDVGDIDAKEQLVLLRGKGGKERIVPIGQPALEALDHYSVRARPSLDVHHDRALFLNRRGRRMGRQSAFNMVASAAQRAGIEGVSPHSFRHSFATHLLEGGADIRVVQELLGHSTVATTQIYTKVSPQHLREAWSASHPRSG